MTFLGNLKKLSLRSSRFYDTIKRIIDELNGNKEDSLYQKIQYIREELLIEMARNTDPSKYSLESLQETEEFFQQKKNVVERPQKILNEDDNIHIKKHYFNKF